MVKLVLILHSSAVDFGSHTARIHKRAGTDGQLVAPLTNFERSLTGRNALTPLGVNAELAFDPAETLFEGAGPLRGDPAGMPIETEYTDEGVEAERIGQATKPLLGTAIDDDMCGTFARAPRQPREEPQGARPGCNGRLT